MSQQTIKGSPEKISLVFYRGTTEKEPVREWLKALDPQDRRVVGIDLMRAQWRWPVGMPLCKAMGRGLWEIRITLPSNRIARVLVCLDEGVLVALHAFIKKSQKTPGDELAVARKRQKDLHS
jgi:phage-related protein